MLITISDLGRPLDGTLTLDLAEPLNGRELHLIKQIAGVRAGELDEALAASDYDVVIAFAAIALVRAGRVTKERVSEAIAVLTEARVGTITVAPDAEDDALPPAEAPTGADENSASSSEDSQTTGDDRRETGLNSTGSHGLVTGAV